MKPEEVTKLEDLASKATEGEWTAEYIDDPDDGYGWNLNGPTYTDDGGWTEHDAKLVAASRQAVPQLCAALREAWARAERAERLLHDLTPMGSEFYANPEKCARWIVQDQANSNNLLVQAYSRARRAEEVVKAARSVDGDAGEMAYGLIGEPMKTYATVSPGLMLALRAALAAHDQEAKP